MFPETQQVFLTRLPMEALNAKGLGGNTKNLKLLVKVSSIQGEPNSITTRQV